MKKISRRNFLLTGAIAFSFTNPCFALPFKSILDPLESGPDDIKGKIFKGDAPKELWKWSKEGFLYKQLSNKKVICGICPNRCVLSPGDRSICRSKVNIDGKLYSLAYGNPCSVNIDPIEKKPLYHFLPTSKAFSLATTGCNLRCLNCQNWEISQVKPHEVRHYELFPSDAVKIAQKNKCLSIAYTYSEATTYFEYMIDTARIARENSIKNLWISNGYINKKPLLELCKVLDGANVNLKSYSDKIYKKLNGGRLEPVLNTFKTLREQNIHFEITHLVVPGYVDNEDLFKQMCGWILENLGTDYPLHLSRFSPRYKLDRLPPTPVSTLNKFHDIATKAGINYVYIGNVAQTDANNTFCYNCKKLLIERKGYYIPFNKIVDGKCSYCGVSIPGVF